MPGWYLAGLSRVPTITLVKKTATSLLREGGARKVTNRETGVLEFHYQPHPRAQGACKKVCIACARAPIIVRARSLHARDVREQRRRPQTRLNLELVESDGEEGRLLNYTATSSVPKFPDLCASSVCYVSFLSYVARSKQFPIFLRRRSLCFCVIVFFQNQRTKVN